MGYYVLSIFNHYGYVHALYELYHGFIFFFKPLIFNHLNSLSNLKPNSILGAITVHLSEPQIDFVVFQCEACF
jgi:hypothetical protein